jgi:hypothetical protein
MRTTDKFQDFITLNLAKVSTTTYKDALHERITWQPQEVTTVEQTDINTKFAIQIARFLLNTLRLAPRFHTRR